VSFAHLCLVVAVGLFGPLLALPQRWHVPVVVGELAAGVALGPTGTSTLDAGNPTFTFLADLGFALVMFVVGTHVPVRDPALRPALKVGLVRAVGVGAVAVALGAALSHAFDTGHAALYAVLLTSSSAALILPIVDGLALSGPTIVQLLPQVAIADAACIVLLPLAIEPSRAGRSALGALAVLACSGAFYLFLREATKRGWQQDLHDESKDRNFALELRISLMVLFGLAAIAVQTHVSIMLAGFGLGIAVAAVGEPRRLAKQMFGVTEGFFGPLFFVWLGASLDLRALSDHPKFIGLGLLLGLGAVLTHTAMVVTRQAPAAGALAAAQLGVPVAATTLGQQLHLLQPGEPAALILGALVTIVAATLAGGLLSRAGRLCDQGTPTG
jgi:Kef-type K+ transport system membrane component KefB